MLKRTLSRNANANPEDVLATKRALAAAGLYAIPDWGITPFPDEAMFKGIETFQRRSGHPRPDGVARPGDETAHALAGLNAGAAKGGLIHVDAYEQTRSGHATPVSEHFRGRSGEGGGKGDGKGSDLPPIVPPVKNPRVRGKDGYGEGHYGAGRGEDKDGNPRTHTGVDLVTTPGKIVQSPVSGRVETRPANNGGYNNGDWIEPYPDDPEKRGQLKGVGIITPDGHRVRILYVDPDAVGLRPGQRIEAGQPIGAAQDLSGVYPPKKKGPMTNHIHVDVRGNGQFKNPTGEILKR